MADLPTEICCPITLELMEDPVVLPKCMHHFDRKAILEALEKHNECPICRDKVDKPFMLVPAHALKILILRYKESKSGFVFDDDVDLSIRISNALDIEDQNELAKIEKADMLIAHKLQFGDDEEIQAKTISHSSIFEESVLSSKLDSRRSSQRPVASNSHPASFHASSSSLFSSFSCSQSSSNSRSQHQSFENSDYDEDLALAMRLQSEENYTFGERSHEWCFFPLKNVAAQTLLLKKTSSPPPRDFASLSVSSPKRSPKEEQEFEKAIKASKKLEEKECKRNEKLAKELAKKWHKEEKERDKSNSPGHNIFSFS